MVRWQIREVGQSNYVSINVNPSEYGRSKQVEADYQQLLDGSYCRVVAPNIYKKEEFQVIWANVNQAQLDMLSGFINKKVEIKDHLLATSQVYIDQVNRQYLISGTPDQRYAVNIKVREV